jgi:hypothetical protein
MQYAFFYSVWSGNTDLRQARDCDARPHEQQCNMTFLFVTVFGLATLIFNGLEIAMHATMNDKNCVDDVVIAHPILQVMIKIFEFIN